MRSHSRTRVALAAALVGAPLALAAAACDPPQPYAQCGYVGFAPASDYGVFQIKAHQTSCTTAKAVAVQAKNDTTLDGYSYLGWTCGKPVHYGQLGYDYWCTAPGGSVVTFTYS